MRNAIKVCLMTTLCTWILVGPLYTCAQTESQSLLQDEDTPTVPVKVKSHRVDFAHLALDGYFAGGTWLDASTTSRGLHLPTMAYRSNGTFLMRYVVTEDGWAKCLGDRNAFAASGANVILNLGVAEVSRRWYRRGGRWRIAAVVLEGAKATDSFVAGIRNERIAANVDRRVRTLTGYQGVVVWRH